MELCSGGSSSGKRKQLCSCLLEKKTCTLFRQITLEDAHPKAEAAAQGNQNLLKRIKYYRKKKKSTIEYIVLSHNETLTIIPAIESTGGRKQYLPVKSVMFFLTSIRQPPKEGPCNYLLAEPTVDQNINFTVAFSERVLQSDVVKPIVLCSSVKSRRHRFNILLTGQFLSH